MKQDNFRMDDRTFAGIKEQIATLAASYTPEWRFDEDNPDIGSVLMLLFASWTHDNVERFNLSLERYHTEFVNLLDISLLPAHPACAVVLLELVPDTVPGMPLEKGTRLLADQDGEKLIFETAYPVYLTNSSLAAMYMACGKSGHVRPLLGSFSGCGFLRDLGLMDQEADGAENMKPFKIFSFTGEHLDRYAATFYHQNIFDVEGETITVKVSGCPEFAKGVEEGHYRFRYLSEQGLLEVEDCRVEDGRIFLKKKLPNRRITENGQDYSILAVEADGSAEGGLMIEDIGFSSSGEPRTADYVGNGSIDYETGDFRPFGDTLSLFAECYIGQDQYFGKPGAQVTVQFKTSFYEHMVGYTREVEDKELKIIKRRPRAAVENMIFYSHVEELAIEYYNGIGWKRLSCDKDYRSLFAAGQAGYYELSFRCPDDWQRVAVGSYQGRALRIQVLRADNCYFQPCIHTCPEITELTVSYSYEGSFEKPELGRAYSGTLCDDFTKQLQENRPFHIFTAGRYTDTALYLGFTEVFDNGPVSLWWKLSGEDLGRERKLHYYYSTASGFKEMKVVDYTGNLQRTGIVLFMPASDMAVFELEGKRMCWIKVAAEPGQETREWPRVECIAPNAVEAANIETLDEEEFYIDRVEADMSFPIRADGILDADVWVNERDDWTGAQMREIERQMPDRVRITSNYLGDIEEFYVKWEERDNFSHSMPDARHYVLDRMNNRIRFGDGLHVRIPQNTRSIAFLAQVRCCRGQEGNVPAMSINESTRNLMYVQDIYNPDPAYGGSSMESLERALGRGASFISSRGRFVTEADYVREIRSFSDAIDKVALVTGYDRYGGQQENEIHVVLLMRDFEAGPGSFYRMQDELRRHLLLHCELTVAPEEILVEAPVFVELDVNVWAQIVNLEDSFEIQNRMEAALRAYLNPVSDERRKGWEIGMLPRRAQILMCLSALKSKAIVRQVMVTARYASRDGVHEIDLDELKVTPYMVVKSGTHKIHITKA